MVVASKKAAPQHNNGMRVRADVSAVAVADIRNGGAMGGNAGRFVKVPYFGSFFVIKSVIMVSWKSNDSSFHSKSPFYTRGSDAPYDIKRTKVRKYRALPF